MRLQIDQGITVWVDDKDADLLHGITQPDFDATSLDEQAPRRLQNLIRKNVVKRRRKGGKTIYEIRRDISW